MFHHARLKLTIWYLLIIMTISLAFSVVIFNNTVIEVTRGLRMQQARIGREMGFGPVRVLEIDRDLLEEVKSRVRVNLFLINLAILGVSGAAGYFLAGRTLKPIKEMVEDQNLFVADASHELRTPLTALRTEIEVGLRNDHLTAAEARDLLISNLEEVNNLQLLTDGLIKLAANQEEQNQLNLIQTNLKKISHEAVKRIKTLASQKRIKITNQARTISLEADEGLLIELLVILLDNSVKYSPQGSEVKIGTKKLDDSVWITVSDKGIGMSAEEIPHLFDRFYRSDKSRSKAGVSGYGLGLAIAKQIVDRHRGTIKVTSQVDRGTKFIIKLPFR